MRPWKLRWSRFVVPSMFTRITQIFLLISVLMSGPLLAADWPQWMGPQRDGIWDEPGIAERADPATAEMVWSAKVGGGYAGPAVAGDRVFLMSRYGVADQTETSGGLQGEEELLCLHRGTGSVLWKQRWPALYKIDYHSGPRVTPTVHDGLVYALGAEGHLLCADAADGAVKWRKELREVLPCESPTWGFAGHPLIFGDLLICLGGGDGSTCVAFDRKSGVEKWRALSSKQAGYCPPVLIEHGGVSQLIVWHGEAINALDPSTGNVHWSIPRESRYGVSMASPILRGDEMLVSAYWWGSRLFKLNPNRSAPETLWQTEKEGDTRTEHLNSLMGSPLAVDDHFYGVCSRGQLRCLEWKTGKRLWETMAATGGKEDRWVTAFLTRLGRRGNEFLLFNEQGELIRATLTPESYQEKSRRPLIEPNSPDVKSRKVVWSHPAYSEGNVYVRNDGEIRCWRLVR